MLDGGGEWCEQFFLRAVQVFFRGFKGILAGLSYKFGDAGMICGCTILILCHT